MAPPAGLEPAIFGLEVRRLVHYAKGAVSCASSWLVTTARTCASQARVPPTHLDTQVDSMVLRLHGFCNRAQQAAIAVL